MEGSDGLFLVVTTNRVDALDPALGVPDAEGRSTRPGRIDRVVELKPLSEDCRRKVAARILRDCPDEVEPAVAAGAGESGAQFVERCRQTALLRHWEPPTAHDQENVPCPPTPHSPPPPVTTTT